MTRVVWALVALAAHWRRHPINFAALVLGLAIATALWSGVQALNEQARESYRRAAQLFSGGAGGVVATSGGLFAQDLYVKLRLTGYKVSPALEGSVRIGRNVHRLIGVEPMTLPRRMRLSGVAGGDSFSGFLRPPGETIVAQQMLKQIGAAEGDAPLLSTGRKLPPLAVSAEAPADALIVDISFAQSLLGKPKLLSRLVLGDGPKLDQETLKTLSGGALHLVEPQETPELESLTASFHLNLTAFGFLAFLVGLFIVRASFGLGFEQRLPTIRTLRAIGVSACALVAALVAELTLLGLLAGALGVACGYFLAAALMPNVAASLDSLYGAQVSSRLSLDPAWFLSGVGMALLGALAAAASSLVKAFHLPTLQVAQPFAWREEQQRVMLRQAALAAAALAVALAALLFGESLAAGFVSIAGALIGAALLLPLLLAVVLRFAEHHARTPLWRWFWADGRQQLSALSLALMALLIALATNVGVGTMVEGFRQTFVSWIDERLVAEAYFEAASAEDAQPILAWLQNRAEVAAILPTWRTQMKIAGGPVEVFGTQPHETYRAHFPLLDAAPDAWARLARGDGVMVSEQLARRLKLRVGSMFEIAAPGGLWRAEVVGVYPDYGNPKGQLRVDLDALVAHWPDALRTNYSLRLRAPQDAAPLLHDLEAQFGAKIARAIDQAGVKEISIGVFERTFAVTAALNTLTLLVSGVALLATLMTLGNLRLAQLAPVWALGVPRRRLALMEFFRLPLLALATAAFALPLGLVMAWLLVAVVNVEAFGWRVPFHVFPGQWAQVLALSVVTALAAAAIPVLRLARTAPAQLLKVFADER